MDTRTAVWVSTTETIILREGIGRFKVVGDFKVLVALQSLKPRDSKREVMRSQNPDVKLKTLTSIAKDYSDLFTNSDKRRVQAL